MKPRVRLENWSVTQFDQPWLAPEIRETRLQGAIYGHPAHEDGRIVTLGPATAIDASFRMVVTDRTIYLLGAIKPEYAAAFENAEDRFWQDWSDKLPRPGLVDYLADQIEMLDKVADLRVDDEINNS